MRYAIALLSFFYIWLGPGLNAASAQNFEGKTIRMVINFGAGGPLDAFFRPFIPYFEEILPGRPTIIMEHRPGATGRIGSTYLYNIAKPDGLLPVSWTPRKGVL